MSDTNMMAKAPKSPSLLLLLLLLPSLHPSLQLCTFHTCILILWGSLHVSSSACRYWFCGRAQPKLIKVGVDVRVHPIWYPITTIWVLHVFRTEKFAVAFVVTQIVTRLRDTMFNTW